MAKISYIVLSKNKFVNLRLPVWSMVIFHDWNIEGNTLTCIS